jgi:hypothetical protein
MAVVSLQYLNIKGYIEKIILPAEDKKFIKLKNLTTKL